MRRLAPLLVALALILAPAVAAAPAPAPVIAPGVFAGPIDVGGLTVVQATVKLQALLAPAFTRPLVVHVVGRRAVLSAKRAHVLFNPYRTAKRAYEFGVAHPPAPPAPASGGSPTPPEGVPLVVRHLHHAVAAFAAEVAKLAARKPIDATARITLTRIEARHSRPGRELHSTVFIARANAALDNPVAHHVIAAPVRAVAPKIKVADLASRYYATVLTIDRGGFRLRLFKNMRLSKSYGIAVGMAGLETPSGLYSITDKQVNPSWHVPNSPWAGSLAGQTIPPGPADPIKARWLGITSGVGIHGTAEDWSIGSRASHGCIRMHISDVIDLYPRVPLGTPVLIG